MHDNLLQPTCEHDNMLLFYLVHRSAEHAVLILDFVCLVQHKDAPHNCVLDCLPEEGGLDGVVRGDGNVKGVGLAEHLDGSDWEDTVLRLRCKGVDVGRVMKWQRLCCEDLGLKSAKTLLLSTPVTGSEGKKYGAYSVSGVLV